MVQKHILVSMIAPVTVAGILIMTILAATVSAQENNSTGNTTAAPQQANSTGNVAPPQASGNSTGNTTDFVKTMLAVHNSERTAVGVPPLVWSDKLAADAKLYAEHLLATGPPYTHPSAEWVAAHPTDPEGENLAFMKSSDPNPVWTAKDWAILFHNLIDGEKDYYQGKTATLPPTGSTGHYTQTVWRTTTAVGCGTASGGGTGIMSCRYSPPGNIVGQKPY